VNTDLRRIGLITAFTGARLAEICGLDAADVSHAVISSINIRPNAHRILKTKSSTRVVPLVGPALDAIKAACEDHRSGPLFPRYARPGGPDAPSAALMKMLRTKAKIEDDKLTWHSWRHTMKDLMRNAGIDRELQDRILGHAGTGVSFNYGKGRDIGLLHDLMARALAPLVQIVGDGVGAVPANSRPTPPNGARRGRRGRTCSTLLRGVGHQSCAIPSVGGRTRPGF
jgi:integrase